MWVTVWIYNKWKTKIVWILKYNRISKLYEEKEGTIVIPVFEFVKAYKPNKYTPVNNNSVHTANRGLTTRPLSTITFNEFMRRKNWLV